jgi:hypothetical protein
MAAPSKKEADQAEAVKRAKRTNASTGLSDSEVDALTLEWGKNELPEKKKSKLMQVRLPHLRAHGAAAHARARHR